MRALLGLLFFLAGCSTGSYLSIPDPSLADAELVVEDDAGSLRGFRVERLTASELRRLEELLGSNKLPPSTLLEDIAAKRLFLLVGRIGHSGWITPWSAALEVGEIEFDLDGERLLIELGRDTAELALDTGITGKLGPYPVIWQDRVYGLYWIEVDGTNLRMPRVTATPPAAPR